MVVLGAPCFSFPGRTRRSIFAFHCGIIYFYSRVLTVQRKELSTRKLEGYMDREGLFGVVRYVSSSTK